jgi:hypothetical protein
MLIIFVADAAVMTLRINYLALNRYNNGRVMELLFL